MLQRNDLQRGTAIVEAAITLALVLVLLFGLMEIARFIQTQEVLTNAAREGARLGVTPLSGTSALPAPSEIESRVETFLRSAALTGATVTVAQESAPYGSVNTGLTRVRVELPYNLLTGISWFDMLRVRLSGEAVMRNETSP